MQKSVLYASERLIVLQLALLLRRTAVVSQRYRGESVVVP